MKRFMLGIFLVLPMIGFAEIYKWVDSDGVPHFSDQPHQGAKQIILPPAQIFKAPKQKEAPAPEKKEKSEKPVKQKIALGTPVNNQTIWSNQGALDVSINVSPFMNDTDTLSVFIDGKKASIPNNSTSFTMMGINPGTHTIQASLISGEGKTIATTKKVTFYMKHHVIKKKVK